MNLILKLAGSSEFFIQEAYKSLRTNLQFCGQDIRVIAVTSYHENEGKTTVTLNLGKSLAELGKRVLVLDGDLRKSVMAEKFTNARNPVGLSEILTAQIKISDGIQTVHPGRLHLMFAGKQPPNPVELLSGKYFSAMVEKLRQHYDYILIDTPPLGWVIDAAVIASFCDGCIVVMADNTVRATQARNMMEQLKKSGCMLLGIVRNDVQKRRK